MTPVSASNNEGFYGGRVARAQVVFGCVKSQWDNYARSRTNRSIAEKNGGGKYKECMYTHNHLSSTNKNYTRPPGHKAPICIEIAKDECKQIYRQKYTCGSAVKHTPRAVY